MNTRLAVLALATAAFAACEPNPSVTGPAAALQAARAADVSAAVSDPGAVYTLTNQVGGNAVAVFARGADGRLTAAGTVSTGGTGTGAGVVQSRRPPPRGHREEHQPTRPVRRGRERRGDRAHHHRLRRRHAVRVLLRPSQRAVRVGSRRLGLFLRAGRDRWSFAGERRGPHAPGRTVLGRCDQ